MPSLGILSYESPHLWLAMTSPSDFVSPFYLPLLSLSMPSISANKRSIYLNPLPRNQFLSLFCTERLR